MKEDELQSILNYLLTMQEVQYMGFFSTPRNFTQPFVMPLFCPKLQGHSQILFRICIKSAVYLFFLLNDLVFLTASVLANYCSFAVVKCAKDFCYYYWVEKKTSNSSSPWASMNKKISLSFEPAWIKGLKMVICLE